MEQNVADQLHQETNGQKSELSEAGHKDKVLKTVTLLLAITEQYLQHNHTTEQVRHYTAE